MRLTLLAAVLLLSLHTCFAAVPISVSRPSALGAKYPKPHLRFKERKGTMGFVYAVLLGPVGYFGVKVFSRHDEMMCYQASRGFKIWGTIVISAAILAAAAALKGGNSDLVSNLLTILWTTP
jgi:hypothetical protein